MQLEVGIYFLSIFILISWSQANGKNSQTKLLEMKNIVFGTWNTKANSRFYLAQDRDGTQGESQWNHTSCMQKEMENMKKRLEDKKDGFHHTKPSQQAEPCLLLPVANNAGNEEMLFK